MAFDFRLREATCDDKRQCEFVLRALPEWFGIESVILQYAKDIQKMLTYVVMHNEQVCGFLALKQHNVYTAEIQVMGLLRFHGQGLGTALVERAEAGCQEQGVEYLEVKTLGSSKANNFYERTRKFYLHCGSRPLEELEGVWSGNSCL